MAYSVQQYCRRFYGTISVMPVGSTKQLGSTSNQILHITIDPAFNSIRKAFHAAFAARHIQEGAELHSMVQGPYLLICDIWREVKRILFA